MYRLGVVEGDKASFDDAEHIHPRVYEILNAGLPEARLFAGVPSSDAGIFEQLVTCLTPPYFLLYVLHTPRADNQKGRYQSPELSPSDISGFIREYRDYLAADGRFDLWGYSPSDQATVVWDRHNYLFGYGPIDRFVGVLQSLGYTQGQVDRIAGRPHTHHYRAEFDNIAEAVLKAYEWIRSDLRPQDEQ